MVRTRSIGKSGQSNQETSFKPSPTSKGRKRQITQTEDSSPSVLTSSAALSPLPGPSGSQTYSRYLSHSQNDDHLSPGRRSSNSDQEQEQPMEPNQNWEEQDEGYLTPGGAHANLSQVVSHQNQQVNSSQHAAISLPNSYAVSHYLTTAQHTLATTTSASSLHPIEAAHLQPGGNLLQGNLSTAQGTLTTSTHPCGDIQPGASQSSGLAQGGLGLASGGGAVFHSQGSVLTPTTGAQQGSQTGLQNQNLHNVQQGGSVHAVSAGQIVHHGSSSAQDLVGTSHGEENAADLVIFNTRESGVQADVDSASSLAEARDSAAGFLPDDIKHSLECPVCARIALPPVMQCRNGHVTCNACRIKVQSCPMCREIDIDIRNLFAEKAITYMSIPCEFKSFGCRVEIHFKDKEMHERQCRYRPYICPYIECDHKLAADSVVLHVSTTHREECRRSDGPEITASMILIGMYFGGDGAWSPRVITCFGRTFFDVALTRDRWLHHWVWLLGEEEESNHFLYEITAFKGNTKYVYGSEVSSLRTSDDEIVSEGKCLSISDAIGRRLRDGDKIRYKLKLMRKT